MTSCSIDGNPDLYGLGIRLGIYFQIIATILVNHFVPDEVSGVWDTNGIFILAVFAAVANATVTHTIQYIEAFVMLQLIFAFLLASGRTSSPTKWSIRGSLDILEDKDVRFLEKNLGTSFIGELWRSYLALAIACFNVWFWFKFDIPTCGAHIFLFAKASPMPIGQQVYRVLSVIYFTWEAMPLIVWVVLVSAVRVLTSTIKYIRADGSRQPSRYHFSRACIVKVKSLFPRFLDFYYAKGKKNSENDLRTLRRLRNHQDALRKDIYWQWRFGRARLLSKWWDFISVACRVAILTWFVLAIELTLSWNTIGDIYNLSSVGQLIPFVTGLLGLLRSVHLVIMESLEKRQKSRFKPPIRSKPDSASWRYRLNDKSYAQFDASRTRMTRRWSFDAQDLPANPPANCKGVIDGRDGGHIQPILPFASNLSSTSVLLRTLQTRQQIAVFLNRRVIYRDMAEWHYPLRDGSLQIFPVNECKRRWSLDDQNHYGATHPYKANNEQDALSEFGSSNGYYDRNRAGGHPQSGSDRSPIESDDGQNYLGPSQRYKLRDGRTVTFPALPWDYDVEGSPIPMKRFSFDDKDEVINSVRVNPPASIPCEDFDSTSNTGAPAKHRSMSSKTQRFILKTLGACAVLCCFPCGILYGLCKADHKSSHSSATTASSQPSAKEPGKFRRRLLGFLAFILCCPISLPVLYQFRKKAKKEENNQRMMQRRQSFEDSYIKRHGHHSKAYMQSKIIRERSHEMHYERRKRRFKVAGQILKSLVGLDLSSRKTDPEERKKETKARLQAWAREQLGERDDASQPDPHAQSIMITS